MRNRTGRRAAPAGVSNRGGQADGALGVAGSRPIAGYPRNPRRRRDCRQIVPSDQVDVVLGPTRTCPPQRSHHVRISWYLPRPPTDQVVPRTRPMTCQTGRSSGGPQRSGACSRNGAVAAALASQELRGGLQPASRSRAGTAPRRRIAPPGPERCRGVDAGPGDEVHRPRRGLAGSGAKVSGAAHLRLDDRRQRDGDDQISALRTRFSQTGGRVMQGSRRGRERGE
jgi:hypothetical protein